MKISQENGGARNARSSFGDMMGRENRSAQNGKRAANHGGERRALSQTDQQKILQKFNDFNQRLETIGSNSGLGRPGAAPLTGRFAPSSEARGNQTIEQAFENRQPRSNIERLFDNASLFSKF